MSAGRVTSIRAELEGIDERSIYATPRGFSLKPSELLRLLKLLYGLTDCRDYWNATITNNMKKDLNMTALTGDLACFSHIIQGKLHGMIGTLVDDSIEMGTETFIETSKLTKQRFKSKPRQYDNMTYAGITICKEGKSYFLNKSHYANGLKELSIDCTYELFKEGGQEIAWITHKRPDFCAAVTKMARITAEKFSRIIVKLANATIKKSKEKREGRLQNLIRKTTR